MCALVEHTLVVCLSRAQAYSVTAQGKFFFAVEKLDLQ